jgi:hypothetical protein
MKRRYLRVPLTLVFASCLALTGCESLHHNLRSQDRDPEVKNASAETETSDADKVLDVKSDGKTKKPFFSATRLSGGLSSEAREIESDMGITR